MFSKLKVRSDVELTHIAITNGLIQTESFIIVPELFDPKVFFLQTVTSQPGVYRMYDTSGVVIYVGKAKDLKNA